MPIPISRSGLALAPLREELALRRARSQSPSRRRCHRRPRAREWIGRTGPARAGSRRARRACQLPTPPFSTSARTLSGVAPHTRRPGEKSGSHAHRAPKPKTLDPLQSCCQHHNDISSTPYLHWFSCTRPGLSRSAGGAFVTRWGEECAGPGLGRMVERDGEDQRQEAAGKPGKGDGSVINGAGGRRPATDGLERRPPVGTAARRAAKSRTADPRDGARQRSAGLRPASRGSAKPAPRTLRHATAYR